MITEIVASAFAGYMLGIWRRREKIKIDWCVQCLKGEKKLQPIMYISNHGEKDAYLESVVLSFKSKSGSYRLDFRGKDPKVYGLKLVPFDIPKKIVAEVVSEQDVKFWFRDEYESCPVSVDVETTRKKYSITVPDITLKSLLK